MILTEKRFWLMMEGEVIASLLGDVPTFTTRQYRDGQRAWMRRYVGPPPEDDLYLSDAQARRQLQVLAPLVVEAEPDVWVFVGEPMGEPT